MVWQGGGTRGHAQERQGQARSALCGARPASGPSVRSRLSPPAPPPVACSRSHGAASPTALRRRGARHTRLPHASQLPEGRGCLARARGAEA